MALQQRDDGGESSPPLMSAPRHLAHALAPHTAALELRRRRKPATIRGSGAADAAAVGPPAQAAIPIGGVCVRRPSSATKPAWPTAALLTPANAVRGLGTKPPVDSAARRRVQAAPTTRQPQKRPLSRKQNASPPPAAPQLERLIPNGGARSSPGLFGPYPPHGEGIDAAPNALAAIHPPLHITPAPYPRCR